MKLRVKGNQAIEVERNKKKIPCSFSDHTHCSGTVKREGKIRQESKEVGKMWGWEEEKMKKVV